MRRVVNLLPLVAVLLVSPFGQAQTKPGNPIANDLAVQAALRQGRQLLARGQVKPAIDVLEAKIAIINGNTDYLATLREAYAAYVRELQLTQRDGQIPEVMAKLKALDPAFETETKTDAPALATPGAVKARAKSDPFQQTPLLQTAAATDPLRQADSAFDAKSLDEAAGFYRHAYATNPASLGASRGKFAYCLIARVKEQLKSNPTDAGTLAALEKDVSLAISLAGDKPELARFGNDVLSRIRERLGQQATAVSSPAPAGDWAVEESANFRVLHHQNADLARTVIQQAEKARTAAIQKWFGAPGAHWNPRCDIYLHKSAGDYARATGKDFRAAGHSTLEVVEQQVTKRRIDLAGDNPNLLPAAIPHEVTHVVLTDLFPNPMLPRWADEAMAILAEPRESIDRYLRALPKARNEHKLFAVGELLRMNEFPEASAITAFYVQSVSLVDLLVAEKGPQSFSLFLQAAQRYGVESALARSYGIRSFDELQKRWQRKAFQKSD